MRPIQARRGPAAGPARRIDMKTLLSLACLLALSAVSVVADIPKPKAPEQQPRVVMGRRLEIVPDQKVWQARLQISQSDFQELRAAVNGETGSNATIAANVAQSPTRTIVAGVLVFFAGSFGGVRRARRSSASRGRRGIAAGGG